MFNAVYIIKYAEMTDAQKEAYITKVAELCAAISPVNLVSPLLPGSVPAYDLYVEVAFKEQADFEAAKETDAWKELAALAADTAQTATYEYVAFGTQTEFASDRPALCHRLLIFRLRDNAPQEIVEKMERTIVKFPDYVPQIANSKFAKVVETVGTNRWDYAFDVDYEQVTDYFGWYLGTPYHWAYIDRFFEPTSNEFIIDTHLCSVYCAQESALLANFRK